MSNQAINDVMRSVVVAVIFGFTGWVYFNNPREDIVIGAILASFTTAVGYYLGHAAGKAESQHQIGQALDLAQRQGGDAAKLAADQVADAAVDEAKHIGRPDA